MKLALDVHFGRRHQRALVDAGHEVVVQAAESETDESWFRRAVRAGAEMVISPDHDLLSLCREEGVRWCQVPSGPFSADELVEWVEIVAEYPPPRRREDSRIHREWQPTLASARRR